jgi:hypothetical protein
MFKILTVAIKQKIIIMSKLKFYCIASDFDEAAESVHEIVTEFYRPITDLTITKQWVGNEDYKSLPCFKVEVDFS